MLERLAREIEAQIVQAKRCENGEGIDRRAAAMSLCQLVEAVRQVHEALAQMVELLQGKALRGIESRIVEQAQQLLELGDRGRAGLQHLGGAQQHRRRRGTVFAFRRQPSRPTTDSMADFRVAVLKGLRTMLFNPSCRPVLMIPGVGDPVIRMKPMRWVERD